MGKYGKIKRGSKVKMLREIKNGWGEIVPKGAEGTVQSFYSGMELDFENRCPHCNFGKRISIKKVQKEDVELVETPCEETQKKLNSAPIPPTAKAVGILGDNL